MRGLIITAALIGIAIRDWKIALCVAVIIIAFSAEDNK